MEQDLNQTILIVDDNPKNLQLLGNILKENNFRIEFATNGVGALEWLDEQVFDLVLLDVMMPVMDGYSACKLIREREELDDMPVIFITAKTDKESILKGFEAGAQDYISKPFDMQELIARVKTHLELRASKIKLSFVNSWLEEKVKERTAELEYANKQLSNLDQAKTEFLNLIGHEIRTPLNGIIGPMELIKSDYKDGEIGRMLGLMAESVDRLEKFALEALSITNLRTGKYSLQLEEFNLKELFVECSQILHEELQSNYSSLIISIQDDLKVIGDRDLLRTCMEKLVENNLFYIKEQGVMEINAEKLNGRLYIIIRDRRFTFPESFLSSIDKLFEPEGNYADSNIGIAMALVNLILKAHNGTLLIENIKEKGATLRIEIAQ